jgi:glucokinase
MHEREVVIGADIGGTKIASARVHLDGEPVVRQCTVLSTRASEGFDRSLGQVFEAIDQLMDPKVSAIGICAPGPLNPASGVIINPPNLPGWRNINLAEIVRNRYGIPCRIENDANAAALAETLFGAAKGYRHVVYATLSTGIGTGIIVDGRIYHGKNGAAGEGGHVSIDYRSPQLCNCGTPGCIEALASGSALAARGLDPSALDEKTLDEMGAQLGAWLGSLISLLDPEIIVIGGGISQIGEPLFARLQREIPSRTINQFAAQTPVVPARFGANVGILGAAAVVLSGISSEP